MTMLYGYLLVTLLPWMCLGGVQVSGPLTLVIQAPHSHLAYPGLYDDQTLTIRAAANFEATGSTSYQNIKFEVEHINAQTTNTYTPSVGSGIETSSGAAPTSDVTYGVISATVDWGDLTVTSGTPTLQVSLPCAVIGRDTSHPDRLNSVTLRVYINNIVVAEVTSLYKVLGPDFLFSMTTDIDEVEAFDTVEYMLIFAAGGYSDDSAENVNVQVTISNSESTLVSGSIVLMSVGAGTSTTQSDTVLGSGLNVGTISSSSSMRVEFRRAITIDVELGGEILAEVDVSYTCACRSGSTFNVQRNHYLSVRGVDFTIYSDDQLFDTEIGVGDIGNIKKRMTMPKGTLRDFTYYADFLSSDLSTIPIEWTGSTFTADSSIDMSDASLTALTADEIHVTSRRRRDLSEQSNLPNSLRVKRQTAGQHSMRRPMGDLVNSGPNDAQMNLNLGYSVGNVPSGGAFSLDNGFTFNSNSRSMPGTAMTLTLPYLKVTKTVEMVNDTVLPNQVRFNVTIEHDLPSSIGSAHQMIISGGSDAFDVYWNDDRTGPSTTSPDFSVADDKIYTWTPDALGNGATLFLSYKAEPASDGEILADGESFHNVTVTYKPSSLINNPNTYTAIGACCVKKVEVEVEDLFLDHGFTVLAFIIGLILGIIVVLIIFLIIILVCKKRPFNRDGRVSPSPSKHYYNQNVGAGAGLVVNATKPNKPGYNPIRDQSDCDPGDSLVAALAMKDRTAMYRKLDNMDILATMDIDTAIEYERDTASSDATIMMIQGLCKNSDITAKVRDNAIGDYRKRVDNMSKNNEKDFQSELAKIYGDISARNQVKLDALLAKQEEERENMDETTADMNPEDKQEMLGLLKKQHESEKNDVTHHLKLEQDEQSEKLRREFSIRRRMSMKELQQQMLEDVKDKGQLDSGKMDWLMNEHRNNQTTINGLYDDQIARQRLLLEEKLARRRALAERAETQEEDTNEVIDKMVAQQDSAIRKMENSGTIDEDEARQLIEQSHKDVEDTKARYEAEKYRQEKALQERLNKRKKKELQDASNVHKKEIAEFEKNQKNSEDYDPVNVLEEREHMFRQQREEMNKIGNKMDEEHAEELEKLRTEMAVKVQQDLDNNKSCLMNKLQGHGMPDDQMDKILKKHENDLERMRAQQDEQREKQKEHLQRRLAEKEQHWEERQEQEKEEQKNMRDREDQVMRRLVNNQVAISEKEREIVFKEYEKQMVAVENSLTLSKLSQNRMVEDKVARRRAMQMEKLQKKQTKEQNKQVKRAEHEDDDTAHENKKEMMRQQAAERKKLIDGETRDMDDEIDKISEGMRKEREDALNDQEAKLGAMLAQLQLDKAKELARIEEQQKAINDLKVNLMDDLMDGGDIGGDPECKKVIEIHEAEQNKLNSKLEAQRARQEDQLRARLKSRLDSRANLLVKSQNRVPDNHEDDDEALKERLAKRLEQKEKSLARVQETQLKESVRGKSGMAAKIKQAAMMTRQKQEVDDFRNRMEKEISQTLEEMRRESDLKCLAAKQDQELQFINGLVRLGKFDMEELNNVVHTLLPTKTNEERAEIMKKLSEGYTPPPKGALSRRKSLHQRVKTAKLKPHLDQARNSFRSSGRYDRIDEDDRYEGGRSDYGRTPPTRLPPMEMGKKKRRKKKLGQRVDDLDSNY